MSLVYKYAIGSRDLFTNGHMWNILQDPEHKINAAMHSTSRKIRTVISKMSALGYNRENPGSSFDSSYDDINLFKIPSTEKKRIIF